MKRFIAISLVSLMLFSSMGFAMATHFCGGQAVESKLVLGHEHLDCGMNEMQQPCESSGETTLRKSACCDNEYQSLQVEDEFQTVSENVVINAPFVVALAYTFVNPLTTDNSQAFGFVDYSPPVLSQDVLVMHQSFLI